MAPGDYDASVHQQLGALLALVTNLREDFRRSEDKSDASRSSMHRRMDDMVDRIGKVEGAVNQVNEDVSEMKPVTEDVRKWKLMGIGALGVVGIGGTALGVSIAGFLDNLGRFFHR